jgi:hypothetical protein
MAVLKTSLTTLLEKQGAQQLDLARRQGERQEQFEKEVRGALARIETKRAHDLKSPRGGLAFEEAVVQFVARASAGAPCAFDSTGSTAGIGRSKKGDAVLRFTAESAYAGAGVVFEAKREHGYTPRRALEELDLACKNRGASAGVFVLARSHADESFRRFARYGSNVLVVWDEEDPATDPYFEAAVFLGMALVARAKTLAAPGDVAALRDVEARIERELERLDRTEKHNLAIQRGSEGIAEEIRKGRSALAGLLDKARSTLRALNVELRDEAAERESPLGAPAALIEAPGAGSA